MKIPKEYADFTTKRRVRYKATEAPDVIRDKAYVIRSQIRHSKGEWYTEVDGIDSEFNCSIFEIMPDAYNNIPTSEEDFLYLVKIYVGENFVRLRSKKNKYYKATYMVDVIENYCTDQKESYSYVSYELFISENKLYIWKGNGFYQCIAECIDKFWWPYKVNLSFVKKVFKAVWKDIAEI